MYIIQLCIFYHAVFVFVYVNYGLSPEIKLYYYIIIIINGVLVEQVDSVKYLGHFLTNELSDDIDIRRQCRVLNVRGNIYVVNFTCVVCL